jgi:hypothetical protein
MSCTLKQHFTYHQKAGEEREEETKAKHNTISYTLAERGLAIEITSAAESPRRNQRFSTGRHPERSACNNSKGADSIITYKVGECFCNASAPSS